MATAKRPKTPARGAADMRAHVNAFIDREISEIPRHFSLEQAFGAHKAYEKVRVYLNTFTFRARKRKGGL